MLKIGRTPWKRNHKCEHPSRLVFFDTETTLYSSLSTPGYMAQRLRLGVVSTWVYRQNGWEKTNSLRFKDRQTFWECVYAHLRKRRPTWTYAHNTGFDFTIVNGWSEVDHGQLRIYESVDAGDAAKSDRKSRVNAWRGKTALDGTPFILECRHNNGPVKFVDSYNYWPVPLAEIGRWLGVPKLELDSFDVDDETMFRRCERDVEIVETAIIRLMDYWGKFSLGNWQPTIASLAFSSYRHGKEKCEIVAHGDNDHGVVEEIATLDPCGSKQLSASEITGVERRSYYGGRTSVLFSGDIRRNCVSGISRTKDLFNGGRPEIPGPVTILDVNAMYGYVMRDYRHPYEIMDAIRMPSLELADRLIRKFWCIADVEIYSEDTEYPKQFASHIGYVRGHFSTSLCGEELRLAVESGHARTIVNLCIYHDNKPFEGFANYWDTVRLHSLSVDDGLTAKFANNMLRTLYGKLAQKTPPWITDGTTVPPVRWGTYIGQPNGGSEAVVMRAIGGVSQFKGDRKSCRHTFVAAAASITSAARMYVRNLINLCPKQTILYSDTDSLFCLPDAVESLNRHNLIHPFEMGKLKVKGTYDYVRIWGQKDYEIDGVRVIAGKRSDANEISERVWMQVNVEGVKQIITHDPDGSVLYNAVKFAPHGCLQSISVGRDGWTTPLEI